jgi:replicative DNA helicase Mcm
MRALDVSKRRFTSFTKADIKKIRKLAEDKDLFQMLEDSIFLRDAGLIRKAIALQLFGSCSGPINILLVGDPGTACWDMVRTAACLSPDAAILTGERKIADLMEKSSLVGVPELSLVPECEILKIYESMKMNLIKSSMIAASAPTLGRFDPYIPVKVQLAAGRYAVQLFDIVFAMRDVPDPENDKSACDYILGSKLGSKNIEPRISLGLLKKYVSYARANCRPKLTEAASDELRKFYLALRKKAESPDDPIPITPRQLKSLMKLAEASARVRLSDEVSKEDAGRAVEIMSLSLRQMGFDPATGKIDIDRFEGREGDSE